jgi:hypothetical protein
VEKGIERSWAIDLAFGLPKNKKGNNGFIIAVERLSRWIEVQAIKDKSSTTVARFIYEDIIARHGVPENIGSDQGREFLDEVQILLETYGITHITTSAFPILKRMD